MAHFSVTWIAEQMRCIKTSTITALCLLLAAPLLFAPMPVLCAESGAGRLVEVDDLAALGKRSRDARLPILLVFVAADCGYCRLLEDEFLRPMMISGDYEGERVLIRTLHIDSYVQLADFSGAAADADEIADRYGVFVTPTLLFLDGDGHELAKRMIGINTVDYFGAYLDRGIDRSFNRLRVLRAASSGGAPRAGGGG